MRPPMRNIALSLALLILPATSVLAAGATTTARQSNGRGAAVACASCHGADGGGQVAAGVPRLAGLNADYLLKQLDDFVSGTRENAIMKPIATALSEPERKAMTTYYSAMPVPAAFAKPTAAMPAADSLGARLALRGRWDKQVPGCVQCHGPHGVGAHFPPLAGQSALYIAAQLNDWKKGTRRNDPLELMQHVSSALDEQDIKAVSAWFAAQPLNTKGATP